jgi:hypothetical protein
MGSFLHLSLGASGFKICRPALWPIIPLQLHFRRSFRFHQVFGHNRMCERTRAILGKLKSSVRHRED